jgi:glycosyltransferase involved in cell wall biosynthesis
MPASPDSPVVLQVLPSLITGGVERGTIEITQAIRDAEGVPVVASAGGPLVQAITRAGGYHVTLPLDSKNPYVMWRNAARLAQVIRTNQVSIVHARSRAPAWSAWLACQRTGAHFVTTYHGTYSENSALKRRYNAVMARGEITIAASRFIASLIHERYGTPHERIRVIPRGIDPAIYDPDSVSHDRIARLSKTWRVPDGAATIVLPGRLTAWKGQSVLLEAMAKLLHRDVCCVLVGSDQGRARYSESLIRQARRLGLSDRVRIVGHVDDMPAALMLSDVVIHASTQAEAFGRVVIEAQAMGRPVIAADLGGPVETVEHNVTGWRVPPGDPATLAEAIDHVLALPDDERHALGQRARAAVLRRNTVQAMQDATLDVYETLLGSPRTVEPMALEHPPAEAISPAP